MRAEIEITQGKLAINAHDLFDAIFSNINTDTQRDLLDTISCLDPVIKNVADQILDGWTEMASHGAISVSALPRFIPALSAAQREVARRSGDVAKREIERLEAEIVRLNERLDEYRKEELERLDRRRGLL